MMNISYTPVDHVAKDQNINQYDPTLRSLQYGIFTTRAYTLNSVTSKPQWPHHTQTYQYTITNWTQTNSVDYLRKSFGFRNINNILKEIHETAVHNFSLSTKDPEKIIDIGEVSTIPKSSSNNKPLPLPTKFGSVIHMDIIYETVPAFDGVK